MRSYLVFTTSALPIMVVPRLHNVPIAHLGCSPSSQCPHCLSWLFPIFTMFWLPILVALYLHNVPIANRRCSLSSRCPHCPSKLFSVFIMSPLPIVVVPYLHDVPCSLSSRCPNCPWWLFPLLPLWMPTVCSQQMFRPLYSSASRTIRCVIHDDHNS